MYSSANDPRTVNDPGTKNPGLQMIPKLDSKWSWTENDPVKKLKWYG